MSSIILETSLLACRYFAVDIMHLVAIKHVSQAFSCLPGITIHESIEGIKFAFFLTTSYVRPNYSLLDDTPISLIGLYIPNKLYEDDNDERDQNFNYFYMYRKLNKNKYICALCISK